MSVTTQLTAMAARDMVICKQGAGRGEGWPNALQKCLIGSVARARLACIPICKDCKVAAVDGSACGAQRAQRKRPQAALGQGGLAGNCEH